MEEGLPLHTTRDIKAELKNLQKQDLGNIHIIKVLENANTKIGEDDTEDLKNVMELKEKKALGFRENKIQAEKEVSEEAGDNVSET